MTLADGLIPDPGALPRRLIPVRHAVPEVAIQDRLHHLGERAALVGRGPVRRRAQRVVDLDRHVRAEPGRAGHPPLRERRRRLAGHPGITQAGQGPADPGLHRLPADAERLGQRAQRPAGIVQRDEREQRIFLIYSLLAAWYIATVMLLVAGSVYGWLDRALGLAGGAFCYASARLKQSYVEVNR